jgi:hypothetical protein
MPNQSSKGRKDLNQTAFSVVQQAIGESAPPKLTGKKADSSKGGLKGGKTRMETLTPEERQELAKKAAAARWNKAAPAVEADAGKVKSAKQN